MAAQNPYGTPEGNMIRLSNGALVDQYHPLAQDYVNWQNQNPADAGGATGATPPPTLPPTPGDVASGASQPFERMQGNSGNPYGTPEGNMIRLSNGALVDQYHPLAADYVNWQNQNPAGAPAAPAASAPPPTTSNAPPGTPGSSTGPASVVPTGPSVASPGVTPGAGTTAPAAAPDINQAKQNALIQMLMAPPPTADSLLSDPAAAAERLQSQRGAERQKASAAERAAYSGLSGSGSADVADRQIDQARSESDSQFIGSLMNTRLQQQQDNLKFAIQAAIAAGQFDQAQALQKQLAEMQDATQRLGISTAAKTAAGAQDVQRYGIDTGASTAAAELAQNTQNFLDTLGFNYTSLGTNANRDALITLMGG